MKKSTILYILIAVIIGITIGRYIFNEYNIEAKTTIKEENSDIFLMQYGVYSSEENMLTNTKKLKNYFYYKDNDGYHVLIGITKNENLKQKIVDSYGISENIYMKRVNVNNQEFLNLLNQYDDLVSTTDDKDIIISAQKQILSKYEELILISD